MHDMVENRTAALLMAAVRVTTAFAALVTSACGGSSERFEATGAVGGAGGGGATGGAGGDSAAGGNGGSGATGGSAGAAASSGAGGATGGVGGAGRGGGGDSVGGAGTSGSGGGAGAGAGGAGATAGSSGGGAGGAVAGAGGDAGVGGANAGNGGAGGIVCMAQTGFAQRLPDPDVRETTTGSNGTFTDECDAEGKLKEYYCEYHELCGSMNDCAPYPTGKAISRTTTCMFVCGGGVCMYPAE
jgi:hypothetical protein